MAWGEARLDMTDEVGMNEDELAMQHGVQLQKVLQDVLPLIRYPTMSVRELYGRIKPLVRSHVIPEHFLTEALFYHLNWGSATSSDHQKRMTTRTLSTTLVCYFAFIITLY